MTTDQCPQSLTGGGHHFAPRRYLARDARGRSMDQNVSGNWSTVIACKCGARPADVAAVRAQMAETDAVRSLRWGDEPGAVRGELPL